MWAVYTLSDQTGVRYVGVTKKPADRLKRHLREKGRTHRHCWILSLAEPPKMEVIEWTDNWDEAERRWIAQFKAQGCKLVNGNCGGIDMRQARKAASYPNIKRAHRVMEGHMRAVKKYGSQEAIARMAQSLEKFRASISKIRKLGREQMAEAILEARFAGQ